MHIQSTHPVIQYEKELLAMSTLICFNFKMALKKDRHNKHGTDCELCRKFLIAQIIACVHVGLVRCNIHQW